MQSADFPKGTRWRHTLLWLSLLVVAACGSAHDAQSAATGGVNGTAGSPAIGQGIAGSTGGSPASGGVSSAGVPAIAGMSNGGSPATGGISNGGDAALGGDAAIAGATNAGGPASAGAANGGSPASAGATNGDIPPTHTLHITATAALHSHSFLPKTADPNVSASTFSGTSQEVAEVDPRAATMMGKLVVNLGGEGKPVADTTQVAAFALKRGFHVFAVVYQSNYNILINDANYYGDARREEFDGVDHTSSYATRDNQPSEKLGLSPADGVEHRVRLGLAYLAATYPEEDWGYYLAADGSVRWSDVIIAGVSHGASSAARFAMFVRASRILSFSGPRDDTCLELACTESSAVVAAWFKETPLTPIDRFYAITGVKDSQHTQHLVAFERLHYVGSITEVDGAKPPYGNSHRLQSTSSGHSGFCDSANYKDACNYMLGVPTENLAGVP